MRVVGKQRSNYEVQQLYGEPDIVESLNHGCNQTLKSPRLKRVEHVEEVETPVDEHCSSNPGYLWWNSRKHGKMRLQIEQVEKYGFGSDRLFSSLW